MRPSLIAALAATVALPFMSAPAAGQEYGPGYYYDEWRVPPYARNWDDMRRAYEYDRWRYGERPYDDDRWRYGERPYADDRWAERPNYDREFDRPDPPPGYERGYDRVYREYGYDPYARADYEGQQRDMHVGRGYEDWDFRRDFREDGRRGYYQDSSYEDMPYDRPRMHGGRDFPGMRQIRRAMRMIDMYDIDGDGRVTQREVDRYRSERLRQFDTSGDEQLNLQEYEQLWLDAMRDRMVDRFQQHDADGDGLVTIEEFGEQSRNLVRMRDRDRDQAVTERDFGIGDRTAARGPGDEGYTGRPEVEAPLGGAPNEPAESVPESDDDVSEYETRPEVEAPLDEPPNEPAGQAAEEGENGPDDDDTATD